MRQRKADPIEHQSSHPLHERIERLKQLFPEAVNEDGLDVDALVNLLGKRQERRERYNFTWAGKQESVLSLNKRSQAALKPVPDESLNWDSAGHLFIEGDNLEALKLLYKSYFGRVKMIYIDPPYNTGNDFVYPDNYAEPLANYLRLTGQVDENGNVQTTDRDKNGRRHSNWLSMMYPRLFLARQLLREDGVIFVSIDDNEVHNLRMLMNLIFGEENFVASITVVSNLAGSSDQFGFAGVHEYCLIYAKSRSESILGRFSVSEDKLASWKQDEVGYYKPERLQRGSLTYSKSLDYPIFVDPWNNIKITDDDIEPTEGGPFTTVRPSVRGGKGRSIWRWSKRKIRENPNDVFAERGRDGSISIFSKQRPQLGDLPTEKPKTMFYKTEYSSRAGGRELEILFPDTDPVFNYPKAVGLIKDIIKIGSPLYQSNENDIVLDFFAGSATTAQAVLEQNREDGGNRKLIIVQLPEPMSHEEFDNIADVGKERIRRVIQRMKSENASQLNGFGQPNEDLGFRVFRLDKSSMRQWQDLPSETSAADYDRQMALFIADPLLDGWTIPDVIAEVAVKEVGFSLTYRVERVQAVAEQTVMKVIDDEKEQHFYICLDDRVSFDALKPLRLTPDVLFVFRDSAIDDTIVANLALACRIKSI